MTIIEALERALRGDTVYRLVQTAGKARCITLVDRGVIVDDCCHVTVEDLGATDWVVTREEP